MLILTLCYGDCQLRLRCGARLNVLHIRVGLIIIAQRSIEPRRDLPARIDEGGSRDHGGASRSILSCPGPFSLAGGGDCEFSEVICTLNHD